MNYRVRGDKLVISGQTSDQIVASLKKALGFRDLNDLVFMSQQAERLRKWDGSVVPCVDTGHFIEGCVKCGFLEESTATRV